MPEEISNRLFRTIARPLAYLIVRYTSITPNQITSFYFIISFIAVLFLGDITFMNYKTNWIIGGVLVFIFIVLDNVDGLVARARGQSSPFGMWYDGIVGFIAINLFIIGITIGIDTPLAWKLFPFALLAFPMQHLIAYFYKAEVLKGEGSMGDKMQGGILSLARYAYGSSLFFLMVTIFCIIGMPIIVLWFFATIGNLFWMASIVLQYFNVRKLK